MKEVKVGIIGFGTVGTGVASCLIENNSIIKDRTGINLVLHKIADIDIVRSRGIVLDKNILTTNADTVIEESDIVVELIGWTTTAKKIYTKSTSDGKTCRHCQ